jgi:FkbM family methyltransferase
MIRTLKRFLPHEFRQHLKRSLFVHQDMTSRMSNLRRAGFSPTGAVDGGAYQGDWTRILWSVWPGCPVALVEPLPAQRPVLDALAATTPGAFVVPQALGAHRGEVAFRLDQTNSGIVSGSDNPALGAIQVPMTTLDDVLNEAPGFTPNFLKLDLQGGELDALAGATRHLKRFEVILLEVSVIRIGDVPIFADVERDIGSHGYRVYDVLPQYYRPRDGALWQMDVFYVRNDSALVASRSWD